ncbi:MAG: response regulator transcription factor [Chloroflexi bacterium]|nr:response regulator transcription factor [Chloroflexota bacterium]
MCAAKQLKKILIVDDESGSAILMAVRRRLEDEGWQAIVVEPDTQWSVADEFESAALYAIEEQQPDGVILDVRFGEHRDDRFKGLEILQKIVKSHPRLPILMYTQYAQGPDRDTAARGALHWNAPVDFIDKLASPEEVVLRLRRLIGTTPKTIPIGSNILVDVDTRIVYAKTGDEFDPVAELQGMKFEIFRELASVWYRSPGELVPFGRLERYSEGDDPRASLRVRIREIKDVLGAALGIRFAAGELIINIRDQGYRLLPPKT